MQYVTEWRDNLETIENSISSKSFNIEVSEKKIFSLEFFFSRVKQYVLW